MGTRGRSLSLALGIACALLTAAWLAFAGRFVGPAQPAIATSARESAGPAIEAGAPVIRTSDPHVPERAAAPEPRHGFLGHVVVEGTRTPIAGAHLVLSNAGTRRNPYARVREWQAETDQAGAFEVTACESALTVEVTGEGFLPRKFPWLTTGSDLVLELRVATTVDCEIVREAAQAGLLCEPLVGVPCQFVIDADRPTHRTVQKAVSDATGHVRFRQFEGSVMVGVDPRDEPSFVRSFELVRGQAQLRVVVPRVGSVHGRVVERGTTRPLAGATLVEINRAELRRTTDANGEFRLPHDRNENGLWSVSHPGHATHYQRIFPQTGDGARIPDIVLDRTAEIRGKVCGFEGEVTWVAASTKSWFVYQGYRRSGTLAGDGALRLDEVPPREPIVVEASDRHGHRGVMHTRACIAGEVLDFGTLEPGPAATLRGRVLDRLPDQPAIVRVQVRRGDLLMRDLALAVGDDRYCVQDLPEGDVRAWVEQEDTKGFEATFELEAGQEHEKDLAFGGRIRGSVLDAAGNSIERTRVWFYFQRERSWWSLAARTDASGRFVCAGLDRSAPHRVVVDLPSEGRKVVPEDVTGVVPDAAPLAFTVLQSTGTIRGTVDRLVLRDEAPTHFSVAANHGTERSSAQVGSDGTFELRVPSAGPWDLTLRVVGTVGDEPTLLQVRDASAPSGVRPGDIVVIEKVR